MRSSTLSSVQSLSDLAELLEGLNDFLRLTRPNSPLAKHLGSQEEMDKLLDPSSPVLFPAEGRMLAIGILAGVMKNVATPGIGHIDTQPIGPGNGLGLKFFERVTPTNRDSSPAKLTTVARLLLVASHLRKTILTDPGIPKDSLTQILPQLDSVIQIGSLTLVAQAQDSDGAFREEVGGSPSGKPRRIFNTILALRALTGAYDLSKLPVMKINLTKAWNYLAGQWRDLAVPPAVENDWDSYNRFSEMVEMVNLWDETQKNVRPALNTSVEWDLWDIRMSSLKGKLNDYLSSGTGPTWLKAQ